MRNCILAVFCLAGAALLASCSPKSDYHKKVEMELASGKRVDSLFLGVKFGMTSKEFYSHCWELNKQGVVRQGNTNTTVLYELEEGFKGKVFMDFYPKFQGDSIAEMPVSFMYESWAIWNKQFHADSLQPEVLSLFKKWYGDDFMEIKHPEKGTAYVKVDGNRRITIYLQDEMRVGVLFTDLLAKKEDEEGV